MSHQIIQNSEICHIVRMPVEVLGLIFWEVRNDDDCKPRDLLRLTRVCQQWRTLTSNPYFWALHDLGHPLEYRLELLERSQRAPLDVFLSSEAGLPSVSDPGASEANRRAILAARSLTLSPVWLSHPSLTQLLLERAHRTNDMVEVEELTIVQTPHTTPLALYNPLPPALKLMHLRSLFKICLNIPSQIKIIRLRFSPASSLYELKTQLRMIEKTRRFLPLKTLVVANLHMNAYPSHSIPENTILLNKLHHLILVDLDSSAVENLLRALTSPQIKVLTFIDCKFPLWPGSEVARSPFECLSRWLPREPTEYWEIWHDNTGAKLKISARTEEIPRGPTSS